MYVLYLLSSCFLLIQRGLFAGINVQVINSLLPPKLVSMLRIHSVTQPTEQEIQRHLIFMLCGNIYLLRCQFVSERRHSGRAAIRTKTKKEKDSDHNEEILGSLRSYGLSQSVAECGRWHDD